MHCGHSPCRGREVCDEHTPESCWGVLRHATRLGIQAAGGGQRVDRFHHVYGAAQRFLITQALALAWAQQPSNVQAAHWARRLSFVREFARYRSATDSRTQIPLQGLLPFQPKRARPYLYSDEEIRSLLRAALKMPYRFERGKLRPWVYYCLQRWEDRP